MRISTLLAGAAAIAMLGSLGACVVPESGPNPSRAGGAVSPDPSVYYGPPVGMYYDDEDDRGRTR